MNTNTPIPKSAVIAGRRYILPFRASGFWVEDARGDNVAEARSVESAKALAELLNKAVS